MPYKRKEKISLLLYYDYLEQFKLLDDEQFRKLIYAMIEFDKNNNESQLDKMTTMAFVPIKRRLIEDKKKWEETCKSNSENARKRWNKEDTTVCDGIRRDAKYADIEKEIDIEKEKDKDKESENIYIYPTLAQIISYSKTLGIDDDEYCEKFFNHYESINWVNGTGQQIKNWELVFKNWISKDKKVINNEETIDEAGFKHKNGRRIL